MNLPSKKKKIKDKSTGFKFFDPEGEKMIYVSVLMFFVSMFSMFYFGFKTMIGLLEFSKIMVIIFGMCLIVLFVFFKSAFPMKMMEKLAFVVFGMAPFLCGLFFTLNYFISYYETVQYYSITDLEYHSGRIEFKAKEFPCEEYPEICVIDHFESRLPSKGDSVIISVSTGLFGYRIINYVEWPN